MCREAGNYFINCVTFWSQCSEVSLFCVTYFNWHSYLVDENAQKEAVDVPLEEEVITEEMMAEVLDSKVYEGEESDSSESSESNLQN